MKLRPLFGALLVSLVTLPLVAQVNDTYVVPAVANVPGAFGTHWQSEFSVFNPQTYPLTVSVTYIPTLGGQALERLVPIPANSTAYAANVLNDIYKVNGTGSLLVAVFAEDNPSVVNEVLSRAVLVTSYTYNDASSGTYGQTIPGTWTGLQDYASDGISAIAHGIRNVSGSWRTNIGAVNLGRSSVTMFVSVFDAGGATLLKDAPFTIPPMAHLQDALPVQVNGGSLEFTLNDPTNTAVVFPYTSTIDQRSGDPAYQSPLLLASPHTLYGKQATSTAAALRTPGRAIDNAMARAIVATANRTGIASLILTQKGLQIQ